MTLVPDPPRGRLNVAGRIGLGLIAAAAALAGVAVFAGNRGTTSHPSTSAPMTSNAGQSAALPSVPVAAVSTTAEQQATSAVVLAAYRTEESAFFAVIERYPVDPSDPRLAATMTGARLIAVENAFNVDRFEDHYGVGTVDFAPVVTSVGGTTATITDCAFDHSRIVTAAGVTVSGPDTERTLAHVTLQLTGGAWKVSGFVLAGAGCVPAAQ